MIHNKDAFHASTGQVGDAHVALLQRKIMHIEALLNKELPALRMHDEKTADRARALVATARRLARMKRYAESDSTASECSELLERVITKAKHVSRVAPLLTLVPRQ